MTHQDIFEKYHSEHLQAFTALREHASELGEIARTCTEAILSGKKLLICGNGGSAADAQHFAAELTGRYRRERHALPALALTTDTSALTCIGNDYAYEDVFSRQVEALGQAEDVLIGISTSGTSKNVLKAIEAARKKGLKTVMLTGGREGSSPVADHTLKVPSTTTAHIQEMHIFCIHVICENIDEAVLEKSNA
ncbi:D-sedoheptulose 7-phosphate isomerase [Deinococcus cellulosilyticus]|uniref:Phosphoheptose isomerase n=1 Tax=Deinococcus cellulosilyticus (strain DSM 18568 / NBRC 106333 / KACC 11606 / 5516J-15) TaxID=1223518 RepID=A0A511N2T4_DEIC1|nr:D-sedoheptulose 7-phosphate isomerase [Deinococcus cellulosilyticus]GEM46768.1 phosphoheptose isomerase 1 [Deinococcus cellulosilyticus NBRC 106333 = KACC 11606]